MLEKHHFCAALKLPILFCQTFFFSIRAAFYTPLFSEGVYYMESAIEKILESFCLMNAASKLSVYRPWWEVMLIERFGNCGRPATTVICIPLFMLLVLISSLSDMQQHLSRVILQLRRLLINQQVLLPRMGDNLSILHARGILEILHSSMDMFQCSSPFHVFVVFYDIILIKLFV